MVRAGSLVALLLALCASLAGCSLLLDFSDKAGVHDASIDGPYTAAECAYKEPNDTPDTAAVITTADMGPGAICKVDGDAGLAEDDDWYRFTVPAGTTKVSIQMIYVNRPGGDLDLKLTDLTGNMLAESREFTGTELITCPAVSPACAMLAPGDYVFDVFPATAGFVNDYTFTLTLQ